MTISVPGQRVTRGQLTPRGRAGGGEGQSKRNFINSFGSAHRALLPHGKKVLGSNPCDIETHLCEVSLSDQVNSTD